MPVGVVQDLVRGREAFERRDWAAAYARLAEADADQPLPANALSMWATAAHLLGVPMPSARGEVLKSVLQTAP